MGFKFSPERIFTYGYSSQSSNFNWWIWFDFMKTDPSPLPSPRPLRPYRFSCPWIKKCFLRCFSESIDWHEGKMNEIWYYLGTAIHLIVPVSVHFSYLLFMWDGFLLFFSFGSAAIWFFWKILLIDCVWLFFLSEIDWSSENFINPRKLSQSPSFFFIVPFCFLKSKFPQKMVDFNFIWKLFNRFSF